MKKKYKFILGIFLIFVFTGIKCLFSIRTMTMNEDTAVSAKEEVKMFSGWMAENGDWYYLEEESGEKASGWQKINGEQYYFDPETKIRQSGLLKLDEEDWYYFDKNGCLQKDCVAEIYCLDSDGRVTRILPDEEEKEERSEKFQPVLDEILKKYKAKGASIAIIENGEVSNTWQYGYAVKDLSEMNADTKIRIASISKIIIAMNMYKMAEEGSIDLDESIGQYWGFKIQNPEYPEIAVTFRSILTHTSSIAEIEGYKNIPERLKKNNIFRSAKPLDITSCSYCNYAFAVGGATMEKAVDKTIYEITENYFFEPMGIDASFAGGRLKNPELLATLYYTDGSIGRSKENLQSFTGSEIPGENGTVIPGGLNISAQDLAKLICILINDGMYQKNRYLSEESVETMETAYCTTDLHGVEVTQCQPLKYHTDIYGEEELYFHTGSAYGVYNLFSYNPVTKNGVIVLTTGASGVCDEYGIYSVCGEISEVLYQEMNEWM